jgi:hypothetical protein
MHTAVRVMEGPLPDLEKELRLNASVLLILSNRDTTIEIWFGTVGRRFKGLTVKSRSLLERVKKRRRSATRASQSAHHTFETIPTGFLVRVLVQTFNDVCHL